jgi:hypothetical protein
MSAKSKRVRMTVTLPNAIYFQFHEKTARAVQTHNAVIERLVELYLAGRVVLYLKDDPIPAPRTLRRREA